MRRQEVSEISLTTVTLQATSEVIAVTDLFGFDTIVNWTLFTVMPAVSCLKISTSQKEFTSSKYGQLLCRKGYLLTGCFKFRLRLYPSVSSLLT